MKKVSILVVLLVFALSCGVFAQSMPVRDKHFVVAKNHLKILANALELYANEHAREYPSASVFYSGGFQKYILKALGKERANTWAFYGCPPGLKMKYAPSGNYRSFKIWCPNPQYFGYKALYFSSLHGFVKEGGKVVKPVKNDEPTEPANNDNAQVKVPEKPEKPVKVPAADVVTQSEKNSMIEVVKNLYNAYKEKDVEKVLEIEKEAISRAGINMEKEGKYTKEEVWDAFRGTLTDLMGAEGYDLEPLNLDGLKFTKEGSVYHIESRDPIIATSLVAFGNVKIRLKMGSFDFEKDGEGNFKIVNMNMN